MSKKVGWLEEVTSDKTGEVGYMGEINVGIAKGEIALRPVEHKRKSTSPDYRILVKGTRGGFVDFGAVWVKTPEAGGDDFLSMTIDHEVMDKPIYVAAFPPSEEADEGRYQIVWGRPKGGKSVAMASAIDNDEVPF